MNVFLRALCVGALSGLLGSCVSSGKIRADIDVIRSDVDRARRLGALRCAPKELATAEANLEFAQGELSEGESTVAARHTRQAEAAVKQALNMTAQCGPKPTKPVVVKIEDKDGDGILDKDDKCPTLPEDQKGVPGEGEDGCPDKDHDGVTDDVDKCIDQPEDKDGFEDEDGCPEIDNDNDGIIDTKDRCPILPGDVMKFGCPDKDNDGIYEDVDKCPDEPEDKDGFEDEDGCPDPDNDGDTVADKDDKCPNEPGPVEENGCPKKYKMVVVTKEKIQIKQQIKFRTASSKIANKLSFSIVDDVALALKDNPRIKLLRIEGHTDSVGNDTKNLTLSQARADAVKAELIKRGIDPGRLESVGFGETQPIASNTNAKGRAENRRTEFNIVEQE